MQNVREDREKYIGGSDIPVILGLSPFRSRYNLLREKALGELFDFGGNFYTEYGNKMEPKIRDFVNKLLGRNFQEDKIIKGVYRYHADGHDVDFNEVLEIKTTHNYNDAKRRIYLAQLLWGMELNGAATGYLAVYERPDDLDETFDALALATERIDIKDHADFLKDIHAGLELFEADVEKMRAKPDITEAELIPSKLTEIACAIEQLETKLEAYEAIKAEHDALKEDLRLAMVENSIKSWETPNGTKITVVLDGEDKTVQELDVKAMQEAEPETCAKYMVEKVKKGRKGYLKITRHEEKNEG